MDKRLQQFLSAENITQAQFADTIGVARASVSHILAGRNKPGFDFIESMSSHYPNISLEWLISGRGRMYKNSALPADCPAPDAIPVQVRAVPAPQDMNTQTSSESTSAMTATPASPANDAAPVAGTLSDDLFSANPAMSQSSTGASAQKPAASVSQPAPIPAAQAPAAAPCEPVATPQPTGGSASRKIVRMTIFYDDGTYQDLR